MGDSCGTHQRSRNRSCRRGRGSGRSQGCCGSDLRDRRVPVTLGGTSVPGLHGHKAALTSPALARGELRGKDRAGTYPGAMLGVPGKPREERDRPGERQSPSTALPAPQQRSLGPPCPPDTGIYPQGLRAIPLQRQRLCHGLKGAEKRGIPQADPSMLLPAASSPHLCPGWVNPWLPGALSSCAA